jgi:putative flippase GtrA
VSRLAICLWQKIVEKLKPLWDGFAEKNPKAAEWVREGGLFFLVSNLITLFKYLILTFLPLAFAFMCNRNFGFPGIDITLLGVEFKWYIIGYGADQGGLAYFTAYMVAMVIGEVINFFIQRKWVFRSNGNILRQGGWYLLAFCVVTCIVNSINCIWVAVAGNFVRGWLYNIGTTFLNGGVSMVVFFIVNKIVFNDAKLTEKTENENTAV